MSAEKNKDRLVDLLTFGGLFLLTIILVNAAIYYDYQSPKDDVTYLENTNARLKLQNKNLAEIVTIVDSCNARMVRYNALDDKNFIEGSQRQAVNKFLTLGKGDSSNFKRIILNLAFLYDNDLNEKKRLGNSANEKDTITARDAEITRLSQDIKECNTSLRFAKLATPRQ